jgi:predicted ArsR family transcriptional regulator
LIWVHIYAPGRNINHFGDGIIAEGGVNVKSFMQIYICINSIIKDMIPTTQSRIIEFLRRNQTASVYDIGRVLTKTHADIRHHLSILRMNKIVEVAGQMAGLRGRPRNVYSLSASILGDRLEELCSILLSEIVENEKTGDREVRLKEIGEKLSGNNNNKDKSVVQRLNFTVESLNKLHFQARWEAGGRGPRIILGHCPYAAIIASHPEVCKIDSYELETRLNLPVVQYGKLEPNSTGVPYCTFQVQG